MNDIKIQLISNGECYKAIENYIADVSKDLNIDTTVGLIGKDTELIALIKHCNLLYDKANIDFKNPEKKVVAWNTVAKVLNSSVDDVQLRWRYLRELYSKYKREMLFGANKGSGSLIKSCPYADDMKFLDAHIVHRRIHPEGTKVLDDTNAVFNDIDVRKLIDEIKRRPILYNNNDPNYKSAALKQVAWTEIAAVTGFAAQECETKWRYLRDKFTRQRKAMKTNNAKPASEIFCSLLFLNEHIRARRQTCYNYLQVDLAEPQGNVKEETSSITSMDASDLHNQNDMMQNSMEESDSMHYITESQSEDDTNSGTKGLEFIDVSKSNSCNSQDAKSVNKKQPHFSLRNNREWDEDELFGQTVSAELRQISSRKKKMKIKAEIYKILYDNEDSN